MAKINSVYILIDSLPIKIKNNIANRSFLIGPNGNTLYKYDEIHMFDINLLNGESSKESYTYSPGHRAIIIKIKLERAIK